MSSSHMMVNHRSTRGAAFGQRPALCCLALLVALLAMLAVPAAADASPYRLPVPTAGDHGRHGSQVDPQICNPEPPDYPGCSAMQVRPLLRARFAAEYTGHAWGYRYHRMGQHPRGIIFEHLTAGLNSKLARLYHAAVTRYAAQHTSVVVDPEGGRHLVVAYPQYRTWAGFKARTTAFCNGTNLTIHFPTQYCWSVTKLGQAGAAIRSLLNSTKRIAFSCDGYAIGGWASR
jgi:hypothetical protein